MNYLSIENNNKIEMLALGDKVIALNDNEVPEYEVSFRETKQGYWLMDISEIGLYLLPWIGDSIINVCSNGELVITGVDEI